MGRTGVVRRDKDGHVIVRGSWNDKPDTSVQEANAEGTTHVGASNPPQGRWWIHTTLGLLEFVPIPLVSGTAGVIDAGFYVQEGDYENAAWAAASGIPFEKWIAKGGKLAEAAWAVKRGKKAEQEAKAAEDAAKLKKEKDGAKKDGDSVENEKKNEKSDLSCRC